MIASLILRDRLLARQDAGNREEAGLHDRVDPAAHAGVLRDLDRVDHVELQFLLDQVRLDLARQLVPDLVGTERRVQEEDPARDRLARHVVLVEEDELVAGDEVRPLDEVRGTDLPRPEAQVRDRDRAGLLRVVDEVALGVVVRLLADDLDRVLVRADGAVAAEAEEHAAHHVVRLDVELRIDRQGEMGHVVDDADGEVDLGRALGKLIEHGLDACRG